MTLIMEKNKTISEIKHTDNIQKNVYNFDKLILQMEAHPQFAKEIFNNWKNNLPKEQKKEENIKKAFSKHTKEKIYSMSDNMPNSLALDNDFFKLWTSDKQLKPEQVRKVLANYLSLTDLTKTRCRC